MVKYATDFPAHGQTRASNELRKLGVFISPSGIRSIWLRHNLSCFKHRLLALEVQVAKDSIILTESQVVALERKKHDDQASGEIEAEHPGFSGYFLCWYIKRRRANIPADLCGTYSKVSFAKLCSTKTAITAADTLNDKVLPFFSENNLPMLRILTDRGMEYWGKVERHDYQLYLAVNDIDHTKTKVRSPTNKWYL